MLPLSRKPWEEKLGEGRKGFFYLHTQLLLSEISSDLPLYPQHLARCLTHTSKVLK